MGSIVVITEDQDRDQFIAALKAAQLPYEDFGALRRHFRLPEHSPDQVPFLPGVEVIEPDDLEFRSALDQPFTLARNMTGANWGLLRLCRRDPPWNPARLDGSLPLDTFYRQGEKIGTGVAFYIIDSGVRLTHDEFGGRASTVYEAYSSGGVGDDNGHGTGVAAQAAGATRGAARGATIYSFKGLDSSNSGGTTQILNCMAEVLSHYIARTAPAVLNMSIVSTSSSYNSAVTDLINAGVVVVCCAGNSKENLGATNVYPAESDADVIVVGGINTADGPYFTGSGGTNWGTRVDVSAAAAFVDAARNGGDSDYLVVNGTSFASPIVAGLAACLLQGESKLTGRSQVQTVRNYIRNTATTGRIDLPHPEFGLQLPDRIAYLDPNHTGSIFA